MHEPIAGSLSMKHCFSVVFNTDLSDMMPAPSSHGAMECGRVKLSDREVSNMWCGKRNFGYICQIEGNLSSNQVLSFWILERFCILD